MFLIQMNKFHQTDSTAYDILCELVAHTTKRDISQGYENFACSGNFVCVYRNVSNIEV